MLSPVFTDDGKQLILPLETSSDLKQFRSLRQCAASSVYKYGLGNAALDLDVSAGNLSQALAERHPQDHARKLDVNELEVFMEKSKDLTPLFYLINKFLGDPNVARDQARARLEARLDELPELLMQAGLTKVSKAKSR